MNFSGNVLIRKLFAVFVGGVILTALWYLTIAISRMDASILPAPHQCLLEAWKHKRELAFGFLGTGAASLAGLSSAIVVAAVLSISFCQFRWIRELFFPYALALQTVPVVAIAPLLIIWSGYTFRSVVIVTMIVCFFPLLNGWTLGLLKEHPDREDLFRLYGATNWQRTVRLRIPASLIDFVAGVKASAALSVIGAIVAEFFLGNGTSFQGLGTLMEGWRMQFETDRMIAALFAAAFLGMVVYGGTHLLTKWLLKRWIVS